MLIIVLNVKKENNKLITIELKYNHCYFLHSFNFLHIAY